MCLPLANNMLRALRSLETATKMRRALNNASMICVRIFFRFSCAGLCPVSWLSQLQNGLVEMLEERVLGMRDCTAIIDEKAVEGVAEHTVCDAGGALRVKLLAVHVAGKPCNVAEYSHSHSFR